MFSNFGIPDKVVSDNGTSFSSREFKEFMHNNGIVHTRVAPYHPSSNGQAERAVQIVKRGIENQNEGTLNMRISWFLFTYRNTPQSVTEHSPAELMFGRKLKSRLDRFHPDLNKKVQTKQISKRECHDRGTKLHELKIADNVYLKNFHKGEQWLPGVVCRVNGLVSYVVMLTDGRELKRHADHLRSRLDGEKIELSPTPVAHTEPSKEPINYDLIQTGGKVPEPQPNSDRRRSP